MVKRKYAISIGCTYKQRTDVNAVLNGTYNDANNMKVLLTSFGYEVVFMNDQDYIRSHELYPSMNNIIKQLQNMLIRSQSGDDVCFYYAGHGVQLLKNVMVSGATENDFELDGLDEAIVPADFGFGSDAGFTNVIVDDTLNLLLRSFGKQGVRILMMFDCCHSGTACDLKYTYECTAVNRGITFSEIPDRNIDRSLPIQSTVITLSGCGDPEVSTEDVIRFTNTDSGESQGVLTGSFRYLVKSNPGITMDIFNVLQSLLVYTNKYNQHPKVTSNIPLHNSPPYRAILNSDIILNPSNQNPNNTPITIQNTTIRPTTTIRPNNSNSVRPTTTIRPNNSNSVRPTTTIRPNNSVRPTTTIRPNNNVRPTNTMIPSTKQNVTTKPGNKINYYKFLV